jgi:hypothetical protein
MPDQSSYVEQVSRQAPFLEDYQRRLLASTQTLTDQPYQQYGGAQLAGFSADQLASFDLARQGIGSYAPFLAESGVYARSAPAMYAPAAGEAQNLYRQSTAAQFNPATDIAPYMNPYQQAVTQEALKELNRQNQIQQQQVAAQASKAGAFGGGRYGVQQAELGRNLAQAQAQMLASDYAANYNQALQAAQGAFESAQQRRQQAATGIAGLGSTGAGLMQQASSQMAGLGGLTQQYGAADVSMLSQSGALQQGQMQKALDVDYQKFLEAQMQPYQRMAFMSDILRGVPSTQSALTATTAPGASPLAQGIGAASAIAGMGGSEGFGWWGGD